MQITINFDDTEKFKDLCEDQMQNMKPEDIEGIVSEAIKEFLTCDNFKNLAPMIIESKKNSYGWGETKTYTNFTESMIANLNYSKMQEVADACINDLLENHREIVLELMERMIIKNLFDNKNFQSSLQSTIETVFYNIRMREANRQNP